MLVGLVIIRSRFSFIEYLDTQRQNYGDVESPSRLSQVLRLFENITFAPQGDSDTRSEAYRICATNIRIPRANPEANTISL